MCVKRVFRLSPDGMRTGLDEYLHARENILSAESQRIRRTTWMGLTPQCHRLTLSQAPRDSNLLFPEQVEFSTSYVSPLRASYHFLNHGEVWVTGESETAPDEFGKACDLTRE